MEKVNLYHITELSTVNAKVFIPELDENFLPAEKRLQNLCKKVGITLTELRTKSRKGNLPFKRGAVLYLFYRTSDMTSKEVAKLAHVDHSTIFYWINKFEEDANPKFRPDLYSIKQQILS